MLVDLAIPTLVDEVTHTFDTWVAVCDVGFDDFEHFRSGLSDFDKHTIVNLQETEELHDLAGFGSHFVDTGMR